jgi:hypothetical protein
MYKHKLLRVSVRGLLGDGGGRLKLGPKTQIVMKAWNMRSNNLLEEPITSVGLGEGATSPKLLLEIQGRSAKRLIPPLDMIGVIHRKHFDHWKHLGQGRSAKRLIPPLVMIEWIHRKPFDH